jgi:Uma2 family endonuclease
MSTVVDRDEIEDSLAELVEKLGGIPLHRIRMKPSPGTATEADVLAAEALPRKRICELIDGVLVEKAVAYKESLLAAYLIFLLEQFVLPRNLGLVTGEQGMMQLWPGRIRIPDVAYISWDRLPGHKVPNQPIPDVAPDLAVEVLSPSNTDKEMELKRQDYFQSGTQLVWIIDPEMRTVDVYTSVDSNRRLSVSDALDGGSVLPGFSMKLADLFGQLDRKR